MRLRTVAFALVTACSFDPAGVPHDGGFVDPGDDGGGTPTTWRTDSGEEWGADGVALNLAIVEPWGALGPAAYITGGLLEHASNDRLFASVNGDVWPALEAATPSGLGLSEVAPRDYGLDRPRAVGITGGDEWTIWFEGEIWLDAGANGFSMYGDDMAFLDLAPPGGDFARVLDAQYPNEETATFTAAADGWYGIRLGLAEGAIDASLRLELDPPGSAGSAAIAPERLRARVDGIGGLSWTAFDGNGLVLPVGWYRFPDDAFDYAPNDQALTELAITDHDFLSFRWAGQLRIDTAGSYVLHLQTDDGQRLWIDGALVLDFFGDAPEDRATNALELAAGWHDIVVDLTDNTGGQDITLEVGNGPAGVGAPLTARPVAPRIERTLGTVKSSGQAIPDAGELVVDARIDAPTASVASAVEVFVTIDHQQWSQLEIAVLAPDGTAYSVLAAGASSETGSHSERFTVATAGEDARGLWKLRVRDTAGGNTGSLNQNAITVRYRGGTPPIAPLATWTSAVFDLGSPVGLDAISWAANAQDAAVSVRLRTCADPAECATATWSDPVTVSGVKPEVVARKYAQLEVNLASDGDFTPSVDWVELSYRQR